MTLFAGDPRSIGGHRIVDRLGTGGMGTVFLGRSPSGRQVAVKLVHEQYAADPVFRIRFRQEVAAARRVSGAFTAPVVDADPEAPRPWMATQFVPGPTLAEQLHRHGPLSGAELRKLALGLVEALRDIHRAGVVHRDLKPANVLMASDGPRVIDFGISRAADHQTLTATGHVMGTPPFMSPEQLSNPRTIGPPSDIFSLAALLVFAAVGRGPFDADSPYMTAYQVVHASPELGEVPEPLRDILEQCLAKAPEERPGLDALEQLFLGMPEGNGEAQGPRRPEWPEAVPDPSAELPASSFPAAGHDEPEGRAEGVAEGGTEGGAQARAAGGPEDDVFGTRAGVQAGAVAGAVAGARAGTPAGSGSGTGSGLGTARPRRRVVVAVASVVALGLGAGGLAYYLDGPAGEGSSRSSDKDSGGSDSGRTVTPEPLPAGWRPWQAELPVESPSSTASPSGPSGPSNVRCLTAGPATFCGGYDLRAVRLDQATGRLLWKAKARRNGRTDGTVNNSEPLGATTDAVLVSEVDSDGTARLVSLSGADGRRLWERPAAPETYRSGAVVGSLAVGPDLKGNALVAQDLVTGAARWTSADPPGLRCNPRTVQGRLYGLCGDDRGDDPDRVTYVRYDPATGKQSRIVTYGKGYDLVGEAGGRLVFAKWRRTDAGATERHANLAGEFAALELRDPTGARPVESVRLGTHPAGAPRLFGGTLVFVAPAGAVTAVSAADGTELWRTRTGVAGLGLPQPDREGQLLYVPAADGRVLALDLRTGKELWRSAARGGTPVEGSEPVMAVRAGAALVVTRTDRTVFAVAPEVPGRE
ncbi:protein kinase [Streptomyces sp. NPDC058657]|uniref:serine/threonine-protein kinase n=1 Tax=unclassified Streptomyces TaxID=2593676 RepID=UPI00366265FB